MPLPSERPSRDQIYSRPEDLTETGLGCERRVETNVLLTSSNHNCRRSLYVPQAFHLPHGHETQERFLFQSYRFESYLILMLTL